MEEETFSQEEQQSVNAMSKIQKDYERELEKYNRFSERYKRESCRYSFFIWKKRINNEFRPDKDQKLSISNYAYQIGMVGENMNNLILRLDNIDTYGNEKIRQSRKDLIKTIQKSIDTNDKLYKQAKRLNQLYIDHFFPPEVQNNKMEENSISTSSSSSEEEESEEETNQYTNRPAPPSRSTSQNENDVEESNEYTNRPAPPSLSTSPLKEDENLNNIPAPPSLTSSPINRPAPPSRSISQHEDDDLEEEQNNKEMKRKRKHHHHKRAKSPIINKKQEEYNEPLIPQFIESSRHINRKWIPRYSLNRYGRDIELRVELPYVKEENIEISLDPDNNSINISGMRNLENMYIGFNSLKKLNNPNYDYFELEVPIDLSKIDSENIHYEFEDYILRIVFPYKRVVNGSRYLNSLFSNDFYGDSEYFPF